MKKIQIIAVTFVGDIGVISILGSTEVKKDWEATGGSRADGTVKLSYEIGALQTAVLDDGRAIQTATNRCKSWGYTSAEAFGGITRQCNESDPKLGCLRWFITKEFQCTGEGNDLSNQTDKKSSSKSSKSQKIN